MKETYVNPPQNNFHNKSKPLFRLAHEKQVPVSGFSKLSKNEKIDYIVKNYLNESDESKNEIKSFWHNNEVLQKTIDEFSENTISNFYLPFGIVPNICINEKIFSVPMVTEESSVVAAASKAAKFWLKRGGIKAEVQGTKKLGQVHFIWEGQNSKSLFELFEKSKDELLNQISPLVSNMEKRGGGVTKLELIDRTTDEQGYYQLWVEFETCDAMGANFINSVLESLGKKFEELVYTNLKGAEANIQVIMAILSNYTPDCRVKVWVDCPVEELVEDGSGLCATEFAEKFSRAIRIAKVDINRATTHNKGIFNGIDAVILATGNDFRAIEACGHTYASRNGRYEGLTTCTIKDNHFKFELEIPLSIGTIGGLTTLHPMAKMALDILGQPNAHELMKIVAAVGLAQNFGAIKSLVTTGIQKGHMKMHLKNILNHLNADHKEVMLAKKEFEDEVISYNLVRNFLVKVRNLQ